MALATRVRHSQRQRRWAGWTLAAGHLLAASLVVVGLWGCAFTQLSSSPQATSPAAPSLGQTASVVTGEAAVQPGGPPLPATYTPLPTYTPYPTQPPNPTYTPLPTQPSFSTPLPLIQPVNQATPFAANQPSGKCCTLRVRNRGSHNLWIGTDMPSGGNYIKPMWYIEFYLAEPGPLRVYWCDYSRFSDYLYDCQHRDVIVPEGATEVSVN